MEPKQQHDEINAFSESLKNKLDKCKEFFLSISWIAVNNASFNETVAGYMYVQEMFAYWMLGR